VSCREGDYEGGGDEGEEEGEGCEESGEEAHFKRGLMLFWGVGRWVEVFWSSS
jgi:hypothetical protein